MGRKAKYTYEQKVAACERYISGESSAKELANELGMGLRGNDKIREWARKYEVNGSSIFLPKERNQSYSREFKLLIINEYLAGSSLIKLSSKYGIPSIETVRRWILKYNRHEVLEDYTPQPEVYKMSSRKTTKEEKIKIVEWCIKHDKNYKETAVKFECSYTQVYQWVNKYLSNGEDGLNDKRGQHKATEDLSNIEKANREIQKLKNQNELLERENALLKKLNALDWK